jgi:putative nucleotidyltransferase with HDIG domain
MFIPRTLAETEGGGGRGPWARALIVGTLLALGLWGILTVSVSGGQVSLQEDDIAQSDISAPRTISFVSESQTEAARQEAADAVGPIFEQIAPLADIRDEQVAAYNAVARVIATVLTRRDNGSLTAEEVPAELARVAPQLNQAQVDLLAVISIDRWDAIAQAGRDVLGETLTTEIHEDDLADVRQRVRTNITNELAAEERELAGDLAAAQVVPTYQEADDATDAARQEARDSVSDVEVTVRQGETVVRSGEVVTALQLEKLEELGLTQESLEVGTLAGNALMALLISGVLVSFLWRFEPKIWFRNRSLLLFTLALLVSAAALRVAGDRTLWAYVVPTAATVLLITILLDGAAGAAMAAVLAVFAGLVNRESLEPAVYTLAGGVVGIVAILHAERLNAFVRAGLVLAATNIGVLTAFSLLDQRDLAGVLQGIAAGGVNAGLSVVLAVGSFAVIGNLFGIMTVFQLLELANPSSRLLRRLLLETPGTYHHSVMVGNLAERAAETIGADPLLARVAAYYHDIGKMKNPLAFIENQAGARNIHDDLAAEVSARVIASHIRDGIDLGYEHGLPVQIIGFIPQHHGTSVMSYFYDKALSEVGGNAELVNKDVFRYPGPKPQSREAAILMLSDGVEASVRSLDDKDAASIRAMVDRIVDARVEDGQLDDAELTLKNIAQIKEAFVQQLLGMYHSRIKYPDNVVPLEDPRQRA